MTILSLLLMFTINHIIMLSLTAHTETDHDMFSPWRREPTTSNLLSGCSRLLKQEQRVLRMISLFMGFWVSWRKSSFFFQCQICLYVLWMCSVSQVPGRVELRWLPSFFYLPTALPLFSASWALQQLWTATRWDCLHNCSSICALILLRRFDLKDGCRNTTGKLAFQNNNGKMIRFDQSTCI